MGGTVEELAAWRNSAAQPHREAMRRKAEAGLIPDLVRLAAAAVEEAKKAAEAAGTLTNLAEAAALQAAHGASSMSVIHEQTTPTEKPASLSSLYQATQALQEQAVSRQPTTSAAEAAGMGAAFLLPSALVIGTDGCGSVAAAVRHAGPSSPSSEPPPFFILLSIACCSEEL